MSPRDDPYLRLAFAVLAQALQDASMRPQDDDERERQVSAREWLLEVGWQWAQLLGYYLTKSEIEQWAKRGWRIHSRLHFR